MKQNNERVIFEHAPIDLGYADLTAETNDSGRKYETPDKKRYPSITTVLSVLSEAGIKAWRKRVRVFSDRRASYK